MLLVESKQCTTMVSNQGPGNCYFIYDTTFLSLTLTSLSLRIPAAAETIIYVSDVNVKKASLLEAERKKIEMISKRALKC